MTRFFPGFPGPQSPPRAPAKSSDHVNTHVAVPKKVQLQRRPHIQFVALTSVILHLFLLCTLSYLDKHTRSCLKPCPQVIAACLINALL